MVMGNTDDHKRILTRYWGFTSFRPLQEEIIRSVEAGKDTLGLLPTGGGKSITFQVPALGSDGICLVITPLIALMKDQVDKLKKMDIRAVMVHSGMMKDEISIALDNCIYGDYKFLYISPERISSEMFRNRVVRMNITLVAVDEAHCISQWGYDFRPSYLKISDLRELLPEKVPFLALTATATPPVVEDILSKLKFRGTTVFKSGFERENIVYLVRKIEDKESYILRTVEKVKGQGIIYVRSRKKSKEIAQFLMTNKISAGFYHAGLSRELRDARQNEWMGRKTRIIVSTNAFGMGIDKEDVRFVIHWDIPDSIESYYQESGRAGRDGKKAWAVLLYNNSDISRAKDRVRTSFPPVDKIKDIYEMLCNYLKIPIGGGKNNVYDFDLGRFVTHYRLSVSEVYNSIRFLEKEGYLELTEELNNPSRVNFIVNRDDLYKFQVANVALDGFIKLILRSYTGLFTDYVAVNEDFLSKKSGLTRDAVYKFMTHLSSHDIIKYIPGKKSALIIFSEERLDRKSLRISPENHSGVKDKFEIRLGRMLGYVGSETRCRPSLILDYFGQDSERCGKCDVCLSRNELDLSKYEFDMILGEVKRLLGNTSIAIDEIVRMVGGDDQKTIKVVRWLLDHDKIRSDENNLLSWNS